MEGLLLLLNQISLLSPLDVFEQEVIVVENPGMQHWLNLAIAEERNISMNIRYALPAQFLWGLLRTMASEENVPDQSPYLREVLAWRIYAIIATKNVLNDEDFLPATQYWLDGMPPSSPQGVGEEETKFNRNENLKRYQLAVQLADLYEQYLIFRPQWLDSWEKGDFTVGSNENNLLDKDLEDSNNAKKFTKSSTDESLWQGKLWKLLIEQAPYNPIELLNNAIENIPLKIAQNKNILPARISFFGINSMAPMWLNFANALSEHVEVHFYHLNPCFAYWGDIVSEKEAIKKLNHWSEGVQDEHLFVGNPLLASLGQQGREFLSLLQQVSTIDVSLFVKASDNDKVKALKSPISKDNDSAVKSILHCIQDDILALEDVRHSGFSESCIDKAYIDESIQIVSCHSALREVQALHDYLLHQFNDSVERGESLSPKDILVMCPQIENYAPYVNAVFSRGWQDISSDLPPLPCSIADRSPKDSDPLIATFSELLNLPDSRFQVSQLLGFIRLPAMANKFCIGEEDIIKITSWLNEASIHWGVDDANKTSILGAQTNANFTWQQGLSRLLRGFAFSDSEQVYQNQLLLSQVEGNDALLLGRLILLIEQLQLFSIQLNKPRNPQAWQTFLLKQLELLFSVAPMAHTQSTNAGKVKNKQLHNKQNMLIENSLSVIHKAISGLVEYCAHAKFDDEIDLTIVVDYLTHHFSQGDSSKQFMVGQVTFCSMLPMRSIPFKIIAVLGLNDGEFPRQRVPLGFDLMANTKALLGDRSRRGDDRYLFLEAIISARKSLYLSFQGKNIKNNSEKQPSIVLKELMAYLQQGYGWKFEGQSSAIKQLPMQAFSKDNYITCKQEKTLTVEEEKQPREILEYAKPSFDVNWLNLAEREWDQSSDPSDFSIPPDDGVIFQEVDFEQFVKFFQNPSKAFAQQSLNLYLDNYDVVIEDVEPFTEDYLQSYLLKQELLKVHLKGNEDVTAEQVIREAELSGKFPDLPSTYNAFERWTEETEIFSHEITEKSCENPEYIKAVINVPYKQKGTDYTCLSFSVDVPVKKTPTGTKIVLYRASTAKAKDKFQLYLMQLLIQQWQLQHIENTSAKTSISSNEYIQLASVSESIGFYFNTKSQKTEIFSVSSIEYAKEKLTQLINYYIKGQTKPLLLNGDIAAEVFAKTRGKPVEMTQNRFESLWEGGQNKRGFKDDVYLHYFWPQCPNIELYKAEIVDCYKTLYDVINKV